MLSKKERIEVALEWLKNASKNCDNAMRTGLLPIVSLAKEQIDNAIKYLKGEEVASDVVK